MQTPKKLSKTKHSDNKTKESLSKTNNSALKTKKAKQNQSCSLKTIENLSKTTIKPNKAKTKHGTLAAASAARFQIKATDEWQNGCVEAPQTAKHK